MESKNNHPETPTGSRNAQSISSKHPRMSIEDRAKQFMPFKAVKGLDEAIMLKELEMERVDRIELTEESLAELDRQIHRLRKGTEVIVNHYVQGHYQEARGEITAVDSVLRYIEVNFNTIYLDDVLSIRIL